jgi:hypothetical protein
MGEVWIPAAFLNPSTLSCRTDGGGVFLLNMGGFILMDYRRIAKVIAHFDRHLY